MRNKLANFDSISIAVIPILLAVLLVTGCARDNARNVASDFLAPPSEQMASAQQNVVDGQAESVIQQTGYQQNIADPVWHDTFATAVSEAQMNDKLILADFTGSDWCHWCVKLKQDVFSTPEFKTWANDNVVLLELDYPRKGSQSAAIKQQNEMLKSRYNISSYPTVLILDAAGNVHAKMGYEQGKTPAQWVQIAESRLQNGAAKMRSMATSKGSTTKR
jgi:protein disulfide-isomerase